LHRKIPPSPTESSYRTVLSAFVVIHTLFILRIALVSAPLNIFTRLNVPLNTPTQAIRAALLRNAYPGQDPMSNSLLSEPLETLLKKLGSVEMRKLYVRFLNSPFFPRGSFDWPTTVLNILCSTDM
jgi:hypothetical protein